MSEQHALLVEPAAPEAAVVLNTPHARAMLRKRYPAPEWAFMEEVAPATGGGTRYADAVAVNLWSSRGHAIYGFEIKVSRSDWLRELKQPEKVETSVYRFCDGWVILAPKGVVKDGELPPNWGHFELRAGGIVQVKAPPKLKAEPVTRAFFASLMRRAHEGITDIAESMQRQAVADARGAIDERVEQEVKQRTRRFEELQKHVDEFKAATGLEFREWAGPPIEVVKLAQKLQALGGYGTDRALGRLTQLAGDMERTAKAIREATEATGLAGATT